MKTTEDRGRYDRFRNEVMAGGSVTEAAEEPQGGGGWGGALGGLLILGLLAWLAVVNLWMFVFAVGILLSISRETIEKGTWNQDATAHRGRRDGRAHLPGAGRRPVAARSAGRR